MGAVGGGAGSYVEQYINKALGNQAEIHEAEIVVSAAFGAVIGTIESSGDNLGKYIEDFYSSDETVKSIAKDIKDNFSRRMTIKKATNEAKRNMIRIPLREGRTLHHDIAGRYGAGKVYLRTAPAGTGVIAGGPMRAVFEVLGVQDVVAKSVGSNNPYNMIKATFEALKSINSPRMVAARRGKKVGDIVSRRENSNSKSVAEEA